MKGFMLVRVESDDHRNVETVQSANGRFTFYVSENDARACAARHNTRYAHAEFEVTSVIERRKT